MFPAIIGTGFVVDSRGIIATNRHVALRLQQLRVHPKTGMPVTFAMFIGPLMQVEGKRTRGVFFRDIKDYAILDRFESAEAFYGEDVPDIAFLQLDVCDVPALTLETDEESWRVGRAIAHCGLCNGRRRAHCV